MRQTESPDTGRETEPDDQELVARLKKGQACHILVRRYEKRLLKLAYGITLDMEDSREVVQDVFFKAYTHIHDLREAASLGGWLRKMTVNACLNWKRKWARRFRWHHRTMESENDPGLYQGAMPSTDPEQRLREKETETRLMAAVAGLPEKQRAVFALNAFEGMSYEEIAGVLGIRKGTVSSRLFHARKRVLAKLDETGPEQGEK